VTKPSSANTGSAPETKAPSDTTSPTKSVRTNLVIIEKTIATKISPTKTNKEPGLEELFATPLVKAKLDFTKVA